MKSKILSALVGLVFLLLPLSLAQANLDLGEYPAPFISDGVFDDSTVIVVGDEAGASDTLGAVDIAANLQFLARMPLDESTNGESKDITGVKEELELGASLSKFGVLENNDLDFLYDDSIKYRGDTIDMYETLEFSDAKVAYSGSEEYDNDLELEVGLELAKGSVTYKLVFDDQLVLEEDYSATVKFLGKDVEILEIGNNEVTIRTSESYNLDNGESVEVDGKTLTIENIGTYTVIVNVDKVKKIMERGETMTVNDLEITVEEIFYSEKSEEREVYLYVGEELENTLEDGDCAELVGEEDDNECKWEYTVKTSYDIDDEVYYLDVGDHLGITFDERLNTYEEYLLKGDSLVIPSAVGSDFAVLKFTGTNEPSEIEYTIREADELEYVTEIKSDNEEGFTFGTEETDFVQIKPEGIYDEDDNLITETIYLGDGEEEVTLSLNLVTGNLEFFDGEELLEVSLDRDNVVYNVDNLNERDEDLLTRYGMKLLNVEEGVEEQELTLFVPNERLTVDIVVGSESETSNGNPHFVPVDISIETMLSSEVSNLESHNLIVIGGPRANPIFTELTGIEGDDWALTEGEAMIRLVENGDKFALIVAGTTAMDTRVGCKVLANYDDYDLSGDEVLVKGTLSQPVISTL